MATNALTADSRAPHRNVRMVQFGILSPDELVSTKSIQLYQVKGQIEL